MKQHNDNEGMQNLKTIDSLEKENLKLKKEIDRLAEELQLIEIIEKNHKEINGNLRRDLAKLEKSNKELINKVHEFVRPIERTIDDL
jgi:tRNA C32,U32 (ribose-2'-O)-methylase TrmJ